jgi:hypothetical protein
MLTSVISCLVRNHRSLFGSKLKVKLGAASLDVVTASVTRLNRSAGKLEKDLE